MPRYINKRNLTIFIGIAVAILIVLSTTSYALPAFSDVGMHNPFIKSIDKTSFIELITKIYLP